MNTNTFYEGTATIKSNGVAEITVRKIPEHACRCDECKELDARDLPLLDVCRRYLNREIDFESFRDGHIRVTCAPQGPVHMHFDKGASDLDTAVEFCLFDSELTTDKDGNHLAHGALREDEFRIRLEALIYGYEIRMRTVHFWKREGT